jgi:hypothetical protein
MHPLNTCHKNSWLANTNTTPPDAIYIYPYSHQNVVGEQPTWELTLSKIEANVNLMVQLEGRLETT